MRQAQLRKERPKSGWQVLLALTGVFATASAIGAQTPSAAALEGPDIPVTPRPAGYAAEKAAFMEKLASETPLVSAYNRLGFADDFLQTAKCTTAKTPDAGGDNVRESMRTLRDSDTLTGTAQYKYIAANDAWYCEIPIPENQWAVAHPTAGLVKFSTTKKIHRLLAVNMHETQHLHQGSMGLAPSTAASDLKSVQARTLVQEAAAHALEVAYAFELAQAGDKRAWEGIARPIHYIKSGRLDPSPYLGMMTAFSGAYDAAVKSGSNHKDALETAGARAVDYFMKEDKTKQLIYNEMLLTAYIARIAKGLYYEGPGENTVDIGELRKAGKLSEDFNITKNLALPETKDFFAGRNDMRYAFEAADIYRMQRHLGKDHPRVVAARGTALAGLNPYVFVDFEKAETMMPGAFSGVSRDRDVMSVLNELAGITLPKPRVKKEAAP